MQRQGFTLIEVMVAVVILAVGMASLFTSEAGAVRIAQRARTTTIATLLARCKMGEIEERVYKEGWPGEQIDGRDECCEDAEHEGFKCEWKVERIVLPELSEEGETGGMTAGGDKSDKKEKLKERGSELAEKGAGGALGGGSPAGGALGGGVGDAGLSGDGGILEGFMSQFSDNEEVSDPIASMAMQLAFPVLKPVIEEGVRRATVTVTWKEGDSEQTFDVVQYLVNESQSALSEQQTEAIQDLGGTGGTGGTASGGTAGKTTQPGGGTPGGGAR